MDKLKALFLCTHNSCRSQMAEGWAIHLKSDCMDAFSAGVSPGKVNEGAIKTMKDAGIDISSHYSKHLDELSNIDFDYVVTVCDNAKQHCPVFPSKAKIVHRCFGDPSSVIGTADQVAEEFKRVRDEIRQFIESIPQSLETYE